VAALCCSAAYWLAAQAHQIFAHRLDHIGFVGVRALLYDYSRAFEKAGVRPVVADTGEYKSLGVRGTPITEPHREYLQALVDATFGEFQLAVKTGRGLSVSRIQDIADGRVFTAADAVRLGLIDSIRTTVETLAKMRPPKKPPWQMSETELRAEWDVAVREAHRSVPHRYHGDHRTAMAEQIARQEHERLWFELQQARSRQRAPVQETAPPPPQPVESATTRFEQQIAKRMQSGEDRRTALRAVIRADGRLHKEWLAEQNQRANRPAAARTLLAQAPSDSKGTP
jgi:ClpP class serine protease